jgi:hypothetical protein
VSLTYRPRRCWTVGKRDPSDTTATHWDTDDDAYMARRELLLTHAVDTMPRQLPAQCRIARCDACGGPAEHDGEPLHLPSTDHELAVALAELGWLVDDDGTMLCRECGLARGRVQTLIPTQGQRPLLGPDGSPA